MRIGLLGSILLCASLAHATSMAAENATFSFGVIAHPIRAAGDDTPLQDAIKETDEENLAFVVLNGMKASREACTDKVYLQRKAILERAKHGLIVSLAANDWALCRNENGRSAALGKLNRMRELFFPDELSLGGSKIPVIRQSMTVKHRSFVENARWEIGDILFATVNIPSNNNHYISDAGRNSEFEDRLVANNDWLYRIFTSAAHKKLRAIVLFSDANPLAPPRGRQGRRDGYQEIRKKVSALATKFPGKVLLVHGESSKPTASPAIRWQGNVGIIDAGSGWLKIEVSRAVQPLFRVAEKDLRPSPAND